MENDIFSADTFHLSGYEGFIIENIFPKGFFYHFSLQLSYSAQWSYLLGRVGRNLDTLVNQIVVI